MILVYEMPNHLENQEKGIMKLWWKFCFGRKKSASLSACIAYYKWNKYIYMSLICVVNCAHNLENGDVGIYILEVTIEYRGFQEATPCLLCLKNNPTKKNIYYSCPWHAGKLFSNFYC